MRTSLLLAVALLITRTVVDAQPRDRVWWQVRPITRPLRVGDTVSVQVSATIDEDWHIYPLTQ